MDVRNSRLEKFRGISLRRLPTPVFPGPGVMKFAVLGFEVSNFEHFGYAT